MTHKTIRTKVTSPASSPSKHPVTRPSAPAAARSGAITGGRGGLLGAIAAEWTKLWTVRSTWAALAATAGLIIAYTVIAGSAARSAPAGGSAGGLPTAPLDNLGTGVAFMGQFGILALATMVIATEYSTGSIRSTLLWVPVRHRMLLSKCLVLFPVLFVTGIVLAPLGLGSAIAALGDAAQPVTVGDAVAQAFAVGGYLGAVGVIVIGIGAAVRSVAGTLTVGFLLMLVLPMTMQSTSVEFLSKAADYLPGPAGMNLMGVAENHAYGTPVAVGLLALWAVVANVAGYFVLRSRDA
ncbi:ABC-2 type transport system permease protein [Streptomyces sp. SceaMP-e96]|uniref:ABC transporter permease n=1 Tax=Streptomyces TaxID=1883 RepID=UPI000823ABA5|nr:MULTISPECIES: ABC transporter permease [unclassified Streptomyces]MYT16145.1 ABC transporter permease subunit [Streptomyces sp. SID4951]SCK30643.1 ABC-2 type transport system permease protein [Streptomyces sp. SceaMP-e96]